MTAKLDAQRLELILSKSDDAWFREHSGSYKYREHLSFTANYVARHYNDNRIKADGHSGTKKERKGR